MGSVITNSATSTRYAKSIEEQARRSRVIAGGVNSNVRLASRPAPLTFERAAGAHLWDVDGNEYIDYAGGMGPMLLGHNHPRVLAAVRQALEVGQCFAGQNEFEAEFGERLVAAVPWIESIRIGVAGSEMDLLAVRIARAVTGRARVLRFVGHYHGWLDPLLVGAGPMPAPFGHPPVGLGQSVAASDDVIICEWNDLAVVEQVLSTEEIACVLMEPVMCNTGLIPPAPGYLEGVRELCRRHGALLVIDEVITGFRLGLTGAQGLPRHPGRHHAVRQGGGVRVPDGRAGDDPGAPERRGSRRGEPLRHLQRKRALRRRRCGDVADPRRDGSVSGARTAHRPDSSTSCARSERTRVSPSTTSAARSSSSDSGRETRFAPSLSTWSSPTNRCSCGSSTRCRTAVSDRRVAGCASSRPRTTMRSSTRRSSARPPLSRRSDRTCAGGARGGERQWLSRVTSEPDEPTRKSRSHP